MSARTQLWLGLLRPRTLFSGLSPIIVTVAYASHEGSISWVIAGLLAIVAVTAQIASNIANDLIDYRKGADTAERTGPLRPLSKGLISEQEVKVALSVSLLLLLAAGIAVAALSSWWLLLVGLLVGLGIFAYSGGPFPLAYRGLGDVAVLIFFGWVPVLVGYYALTGRCAGAELFLIASSLGLASVNILVVNNYRDYEEDRKVGKRTLIVRLGRDFAPQFYLCCGMLSILLLFPLYSAWAMWLIPLYGYFFLAAYRSLQSSQGAALNKTLGLTARNVFFLSLFITVLIHVQ